MTTKTNMKISVSNYGPIAKAENIELCPLTVFVGPSNTGKSYLAVLVHALFNFTRTGHILWGARYIGSSYQRKRLHIRKNLDASAESVNGNIDSLLTQFFTTDTESLQFSDLPEDLQKWANKQIADEINKKFHHEVSRCMGTPTQTDYLTGNKFKFNFEDDRKKFTLGSLDTIPSMKIKRSNFNKDDLQDIRYYVIDRKHLSNEIKGEVFLNVLLCKVFDLQRGITKSLYLPAARTGIMQSHRAIAGALVQRATSAGLEPLSVPTLSGVLSDFIEEIILMDTSEVADPDVGKVADAMEKNILHGTIKMEGSEANQYPQLLYNQDGLEIPLLRSSSMVSELAPVVLFIRHRIEKGDFLIIEEPESHLHPAAQKGIAEVIVHLIRVGVRVMVTTHSDYFLEQLANHVRKTKLQESKAEKLTGVGFLKEEEIGAYVFNQEKEGTIVERLDFDKESGFSPADHDKVSSDLYDETIEILDKLDQQG